MAYEQLDRILERHKEKYASYVDFSGGSSFSDAKNLLLVMDFAIEGIRNESKEREEKIRYLRHFLISAIGLEDYFTALDMDESFRNAEINGDELDEVVGFPDLAKYCNSPDGIIEQKRFFSDIDSWRKPYYARLSRQRLEER